MEEHAPRYLRRKRVSVIEQRRAEESASPVRQHRHYFDAYLESAIDMIGYSPVNDGVVQETRGLIRPHIAAIASGVYRFLLSRPETSLYFADEHGAFDEGAIGMRRQAFEDWLRFAVETELDADAAAYVISIAHNHVRPRAIVRRRVKAHYLVIAMSRVQEEVFSVLGDEIGDQKLLVASMNAWSKRFTLNLDLLLAVYGATERSARWY